MSLHQKIWLPGARPLIPSVLDDEFDGSLAAFNARWNKADPDSRYTHSLANGRLTVTGIGVGSARWVRYTQPTPAAEFVIYTKVSGETTNTNYTTVGIIVAQDLATDPANGDSQNMSMEWTVGGSYLINRTYTGYIAFGATATALHPPASGAYLRMRVNGTSVAGDFSQDGVSWVNVSTLTLGYTPSRVGLGMNKDDAVQGWGHYEFFRCIPGPGTSAFNATSLGREVDLLMAG